mmetsp:Transcript_1076/g.2854  ORF Transcript_1076/g.2854 Transcript_1076/m.2854 type:complete len:245 (-) Transcript_1076:365-1099(-)
MTAELEAMRAELRACMAALQEQVLERQRGLEESLKEWVLAELARQRGETARTLDQLEDDKWQSQNFSEQIALRLATLEASLSSLQQESRERRALPHLFADVGRALTSCGDDPSASRGPHLAEEQSPWRTLSLQESNSFVDARLSALEVSLSGLDNRGCTVLPQEQRLEGLDSRVECLDSRVSRMEARWARNCSTTSQGSAARASHNSAGASERSSNASHSKVGQRLCQVEPVDGSPSPRVVGGT